MSDFWAKKLQQAAPPVSPRGIPVAPVQPQYVQVQPQYVQQANPQYVQQQQQMTPEQEQALREYNDPNRRLSLREAVVRFKGGEGMRTEGLTPCPKCGSKSGYTKFSGMDGMAAGVQGNRPAPHCFECGYNGKFQQGDEASWAAH